MENKEILIAREKARQTELLKKQGKIKPDEKGYWTTPVKGQPKAQLPEIKDIDGLIVKEGDLIEFDGILGGKGTARIRWIGPYIANSSGRLQEGNWIGNGILNDKLPFKIVNRSEF